MTNKYNKRLTEVFNEVSTLFFEYEIKPVMDRYKWCLYWANGAVGVTNKNGEDMSVTKTFYNLEDKAEKAFKYYTNPSCSAMWWILCSIPERYISEFGKEQIPAYNAIEK